MDTMEKKLAEYRAKKARQAKIKEYKSKSMNLFTSIFSEKKEKAPDPPCPQSSKEPLLERSEEQLEESSNVTSDSSSDDENVDCCSYFDLLYYLLCFVLWVILYVVFIEFQFGTVFLIVSGLVFMFMNTRTGPKKADEVSAYSVFNKNCESIDGTLKPEQLEREIRYGPAF